ncbi:potassium/proton antiporter, partial [Psychrobacter sp. 1U2]
YGDWLLSPSVKLGDLPFFTGVMASETLTHKLKSKADDPSINMWQQTVAEYVKESLDTAPVSGDTVTINDEWSLVIKEVDDKGALRTIGLKHQELPTMV